MYRGTQKEDVAPKCVGENVLARVPGGLDGNINGATWISSKYRLPHTVQVTTIPRICHMSGVWSRMARHKSKHIYKHRNHMAKYLIVPQWSMGVAAPWFRAAFFQPEKGFYQGGGNHRSGLRCKKIQASTRELKMKRNFTFQHASDPKQASNQQKMVSIFGMMEREPRCDSR